MGINYIFKRVFYSLTSKNDWCVSELLYYPNILQMFGRRTVISAAKCSNVANIIFYAGIKQDTAFAGILIQLNLILRHAT